MLQRKGEEITEGEHAPGRWLTGRFWLAYGLLTLLLSLPAILIERYGLALGAAEPAGQGAGWWLAQLRLQAELTLLLAVGLFLPSLRGRPWRFLAGVLVLLTLVYHVYEAAMRTLYQLEPNLYSQYRLILDGGRVLFQNWQLPLHTVLLAAAGLAALVGLLIVCIRQLDGGLAAPLGRPSRAALLLLAAAAAFPLLSGAAAPPVDSIVRKLQTNLTVSLATRERVAELWRSDLSQSYDYGDYWLGRRPNIVIVFVESYGSILYKRPDFRRAYLGLLDELEPELQAEGWQAATTLSEAPTWGGGSWLSYTSALFGLRLDEHPQYLALQERLRDETYPSLPVYLDSQGYHTVWLSSLATELNDEVWARHRAFYGVDEYVRYRDLNYDGARYGWGPSPPDQYALGYVQERLDEADLPYLLFFVTQNSHFPWSPLPPLAENWRQLADGSADVEGEDPEEISHSRLRENYLAAIDYQLRFLTEAILAADEDTIFVLVGDHQPPAVSRKDDGWETPLHIISRDPALLEVLTPFGFYPGLAVPDEVVEAPAPLRHEGFYSLFMRILLERHGLRPAGAVALEEYLPEFLADGVQLSTILPPDAAEWSVEEELQPFVRVDR